MKRAGGRRYYRPRDVALLGGIRLLLKDDMMAIKGVQRIIAEKGAAHVAALPAERGPRPERRALGRRRPGTRRRATRRRGSRGP